MFQHNFCSHYIGERYIKRDETTNQNVVSIIVKTIVRLGTEPKTAVFVTMSSHIRFFAGWLRFPAHLIVPAVEDIFLESCSVLYRALNYSTMDEQPVL